MGEIQIHPTVEQKTSYLISESIRGGGAILVNQQGNRFYNEMSTRDKVSASIIALPEKYAYIVFDEHVRVKIKPRMSTSRKGLLPAPARQKPAEALGMDHHQFRQRWNATTALWRNSTMTTLDVPPRCVRQSTKGRSTPFRLHRGSPHHGRRDHQYRYLRAGQQP